MLVQGRRDEIAGRGRFHDRRGARSKTSSASKAKGIIVLDGDTLKLCYNPMGGDRPTAFESTADNKNHLIVLKRAK